jgi:hypothetical protein
VVKDNGSLANILCSIEPYDREILKQYDAQVTVGMREPASDQKLELSGRLRRTVYPIHCGIWTVDRSTPGADTGKAMRNKMIAQIKAIIRENRNLPYQTIYNFYGLGYPSGDPHKAFSAAATTELVPSDGSWAELTSLQYQKLWSSDNDRYSKSTSTSGQYALMLFGFKLDPREQCTKKIVLSFEGYGTAPGGNGVTIKIWNHVTSAWEQAQTGSGSGDETITITISANCGNFVDSSGYVWLLARTTNPSNGVDSAVLYCDFVECVIQVFGVSHCDVVTHRPVDHVEIKPFFYEVDFLFRAWLFESISGAF